MCGERKRGRGGRSLATTAKGGRQGEAGVGREGGAEGQEVQHEGWVRGHAREICSGRGRVAVRRRASATALGGVGGGGESKEGG